LNSGLPRRNPDSGRVEGLKQGPPDFKSRALNHSATPPPRCRDRCREIEIEMEIEILTLMIIEMEMMKIPTALL